MLVVTRRVIPDWFSATEAERTALLSLVDNVKRQLDEELRPDGYNVGFNVGPMPPPDRRILKMLAARGSHAADLSPKTETAAFAAV